MTFFSLSYFFHFIYGTFTQCAIVHIPDRMPEKSSNFVAEFQIEFLSTRSSEGYNVNRFSNVESFWKSNLYYTQLLHNAVSTNAVSTYMDFGLCTRQWGISAMRGIGVPFFQPHSRMEVCKASNIFQVKKSIQLTSISLKILKLQICTETTKFSL